MEIWNNQAQQSQPEFRWTNTGLPGEGGRYVDANYQYDATGRPLSQDEQNYWLEYDRRRAEAGSIARSWGMGGGPGAKQDAAAKYRNIYRRRDGQYDLYDPTAKTWNTMSFDAFKADEGARDIFNQRPEWLWLDEAKKQDEAWANEEKMKKYNEQRETMGNVMNAQQMAGMGSTRYRYPSFAAY